LKILRGEHGYRSGISVTSLARSVLQAPLLGGFAAFHAERLCLSVGHLFIEAMPPTEAEPHRYRNASERQSLSARNAAKPLERATVLMANCALTLGEGKKKPDKLSRKQSHLKVCIHVQPD